MRHTEKAVSFTVSLPIAMLNRIDRTRGDVPRSVIIKRALEGKYGNDNNTPRNGPATAK